MLSQANISDMTPTGATLMDGGATFRVFVPSAAAVYLNGTFDGQVYDRNAAATLLERRGNYWTGFMAGSMDGDRYSLWVEVLRRRAARQGVLQCDTVWYSPARDGIIARGSLVASYLLKINWRCDGRIRI